MSESTPDNAVLFYPHLPRLDEKSSFHPTGTGPMAPQALHRSRNHHHASRPASLHSSSAVCSSSFVLQLARRTVPEPSRYLISSLGDRQTDDTHPLDTPLFIFPKIFEFGYPQPDQSQAKGELWYQQFLSDLTLRVQLLFQGRPRRRVGLTLNKSSFFVTQWFIALARVHTNANPMWDGATRGKTLITHLHTYFA